jgi:hypothetical protein
VLPYRIARFHSAAAGRLLKKSSAARRKYRFVAIVGGQRDFYLAIVLQLD